MFQFQRKSEHKQVKSNEIKRHMSKSDSEVRLCKSHKVVRCLDDIFNLFLDKVYIIDSSSG